jgi:hypothetical protein
MVAAVAEQVIQVVVHQLVVLVVVLGNLLHTQSARLLRHLYLVELLHKVVQVLLYIKILQVAAILE